MEGNRLINIAFNEPILCHFVVKDEDHLFFF